MYCPNCKRQLADNVDFCPECGTNVKGLKEMYMKQNSQVTLKNTLSNNGDNNNKEVKNKSKRDLLILLGILVVLITIISLFLIFNKKEDSNIKEDSSEIVTENKGYNTHQKLKQDYENGSIDVNKYFTELVNYEYDSSKLDEKYKSDYVYYSDGSIKELLDLLEQNEDKIDKEIIKKFLINASLANVTFGNNDDNSVEQQSVTNKDYEVKLLDNDEEVKNEKDKNEKKENPKENIYNHNFTHVKLSSNGNFLIWYTDQGGDAITEDKANDIANGLESAISKYESLFGIDYNYFAYVDNRIFNEDYKGAKKLLKQYDIPVSTLKKAMSVYVFDTGSDGTLGIYCDEEDSAKIINRSLYLDILDKDGAVNYPYIILNQGGLKERIHSFREVYNHELFHHFQYLYCMKNINSRCPAGIYVEGVANLASALIGNSTTTNNFLNGHATVYTKNSATKLETMNDGENYGYAMFPYLYVYSKQIQNGLDIIMKAHLVSRPYEYIQNNTSKDNLRKVSDEVTYRILSNSFDNKALFANASVNFKDITKSINENIESGAMVFYEVSGDAIVEVISGNKDYVGVKFFGYKDGVYTKILSNYDKLEIDLSKYKEYDKYYIAINNSNVVNSFNYIINVFNNKISENSEFVTTFNNYNIEIEMDMSVAGINTNTVSKGVVDERHQKEYLEITTTTMGYISLDNKMYHDFSTGYSYVSQPYGEDVWLKEESASQMVDLGVILDKLINMKNVTKVSDNHYKVKMSKDDVGGVMASSNANASSIIGDIYVDVYTKDGYITKLEYDFANNINGVEKFVAIIKFSNYNNAGDVNIPQSVIDSATEN